MKQVIALALGLVFAGSAAAFAEDVVTDTAKTTVGATEKAGKTTVGASKKVVKTTARKGRALKSKAAKGTAKALDTTGKAMEKALK